MNTPARRAAYTRAEKVEHTEAGPKVVVSKSESPVSVQLLMVIIALAAIGFAAWSFFSNRQSLERTSATTELLFATRDEDPERYRLIGSEYQGTSAGRWAAAAQADLYLNQGIDALYVDREEATTLLKSAVETYRKLVDGKPGGLLETRVRFGLAQALEASGDLEGAIAEFKTLSEHREAAKGLKEIAAERAVGLESKDIKDFYAWFKEQSPRQVSPPATSSPPTLDSLPSIPDVKLPKLPAVSSPPVLPSSASSVPPVEPVIATPTDPVTTAVPKVPPEDAEKPLKPVELPESTTETSSPPINASGTTAVDKPASEKQPDAPESPKN